MKIEEIFLANFLYRDGNDFSDGFFVKEICENIECIEKSIKVLNKKINSIKDMYRFLWCLSLKKMVSNLDDLNIEDELKKRISKISESIELKNSSFVAFINNNYQEVFTNRRKENNNWYKFFYYVLELCFNRYSKGINENVFRYLENEYPLHILSSFEICSRYYLKHNDAFRKLFKGIKNTKLFDDQIYLGFLTNTTNRKDKFLKEQAEFICERAINAVKGMNLTEDSADIIQIQSILQDYGNLAILFKLKCANDYNILKKRIAVILEKYIVKHGIKYQMESIDLEPALNILKSEKNPYKFILLTHSENNKKEINNYCDFILTADNKTNPLSEIFNDISRARSKKYPYFKQDLMRINLSVRTSLINSILRDDQLMSEFANYVYNIALQLQDEYFHNAIDIEKEITGEVDSLSAIIDLAKQNKFETSFGKVFVNGLSMSICSTIEKILRNIAFKEVINEMYFDQSKATLVDFFKAPFKMADLSEGLKYHLEFYLIKEVNFSGYDMNRPGLNIRNNLMHGQDDAYEKYDYSTCLILFFLLLSLLNDLLFLPKLSSNENL